jgi:hypothetical protein
MSACLLLVQHEDNHTHHNQSGYVQQQPAQIRITGQRITVAQPYFPDLLIAKTVAMRARRFPLREAQAATFTLSAESNSDR